MGNPRDIRRQKQLEKARRQRKGRYIRGRNEVQVPRPRPDIDLITNELMEELA